MKSSSITLDRVLYKVLMEQGVSSFTTHQLRDWYLSQVNQDTADPLKARIYVYEELRKMIRVGWVKYGRRKRQKLLTFHLKSKPAGLELRLLEPRLSVLEADKTCASLSLDLEEQTNGKISARSESSLQTMLKEVRQDLVLSDGEVEGYQELMIQLPELEDQLYENYLLARNRKLKLMGHIKALETALHYLGQ